MDFCKHCYELLCRNLNVYELSSFQINTDRSKKTDVGGCLTFACCSVQTTQQPCTVTWQHQRITMAMP